MAKNYLATEETVSEIRDLITPRTLAGIETYVLDFINDDIDIIQGGLNSYERVISN